jgi:hypothetical protein
MTRFLVFIAGVLLMASRIAAQATLALLYTLRRP